MFVRYWHHVAGATKTNFFLPFFQFGSYAASAWGSTSLEMTAMGRKYNLVASLLSIFYRLQDYVTYHQDDVGSLRSLQGPFAIRKLSIVAAVSRAFNLKGKFQTVFPFQMLLMKCYLSRVELVHVEPAPILTVQLVTAVPAIVLVVANVLLVHALPIAAVLAPLWARLQQRIVNIVGRLG